MANEFYSSKIRKFFDLLDDNGDGVLTLEDFQDAASRVCTAFGFAAGGPEEEMIHGAYVKLWEDIYAPMDADGDKRIDFDEMLQAHQTTILDPPDGYEKVRPVAQAFLDIADTNKDGRLTNAEYVRMMRDAFRVPEDEGTAAFQDLDQQSRGHVTYGEIHRAVEGFFCTETPDTYGTTMFGPV
ncbi:hypothetical protein GCM10010411_48140 [Actinomadura fulvescens]|uniref:EF-hand domain-containing protein n=1 Tax=Actinomadura fulvescens TaxID=46160 RepID=A0ABP6C8T7_9ACTN